MAFFAMMAMSLTSCEWWEDDEIAYTLEGTWRGNMYVSSEWDGYVYDATYSEICFLCDPYRYSSGTGYWVDHYQNAGWGRNYVANHIEWEVYARTIKVYFVEERVTIYIEDYRLSDNVFSGVIHDGDNYVEFSLYHTASPNWDNYYYGWNDYYYYAKSTDMTRANNVSDSSENMKVGAPKRFFRSK